MNCKHCRREIPDNSIFCNWCGERQLKERKKKDDISVPKATQLKSGSWRIYLRAEGQSITEPTEALCIAKAKAIRAGFLEAKKKAPELTLAQAIDSFIENRKNILSPSTVKAYKSYRLNRFQSIMDKPLSYFDTVTLQKAVNAEMESATIPSGCTHSVKAAAPVSPKTIRNAYGLIRASLAQYSIDIPNIILPKSTPTNGRTLTPDEIKILIKASAGTVVELPILLAVWLGLRRSEIAALKKSDFDFDNGTVYVHTALVLDENNNWVEKGTKTYSSTRTIKCPDYILNKIRALPDGNVITIHPNVMLVGLQRICEQNNLPKIRFHDLRHSNASIMLLLNIPDKYAMERGGWASKQTMTGRYQHTMSQEKISVDNMINNYFLDMLND